MKWVLSFLPEFEGPFVKKGEFLVEICKKMGIFSGKA
jgi:hypothetical protein